MKKATKKVAKKATKKAIKKATKKTQLFGWGETKYTESQIKVLLDHIKDFNCGAIDQYLTKHVDRVFKEWVKENK